MTPAELRAVRERAERATDGDFVLYSYALPVLRTDVPALCNALEEAWAEIERLRNAGTNPA